MENLHERSITCELHTASHNCTRLFIFPRAGNAGDWAEPVVTKSSCAFSFAHEAAGAGSSTRHSLRPFSEGRKVHHSGAGIVPREGEGVFESRCRHKFSRHGRACPGHPRLFRKLKEDVDARTKSGHGGRSEASREGEGVPSAVIARSEGDEAIQISSSFGITGLLRCGAMTMPHGRP